MKQKKVNYAKWGYIFALPFCIAYLIFMVYPIFYTILIGFTNLKGLDPPPLGVATRTEKVMNISVAEGQVEPVTENIYVPAKEFKHNGKYIIVGEIGDDGKLVAFLNETGKEGVLEVQQRDLDFTTEDLNYSGKVIELDAKNAVWKASGDESEGFILNNTGYNLGSDANTLVKVARNKVVYDAETGRIVSVSEEDGRHLIYSTASTESGEEQWAWSTDGESEQIGSGQIWIFEEISVKKYVEVKDVFANFKAIFADPNFKTYLGNTFVIWGMNFLPQILLALALAVLFTNNRTKLRGKGFFKVVFYMPNIITAATIAMLFTSLFAYPKGPVNDLLKMVGILDQDYYFAVSATASRLIVAFIQFWMWYGYTMIILISGILGISPELFEAADIDGANGWQKFWYVTLPNLKTIMLFTLVTSMIGGMQMFDIPFLYNSNGGDKTSIRTAQVFIYEKAFAGSNMYNESAAVSMIMFFIIGALAIVIFFLLRDKDEIEQRKIERAQEKAFKKALEEQKAKGGVQ